MNLRDYQTRCADAIIEQWQTHRSTCAILPTGCGKTIIFAEVINRCRPCRALVIAHRKELIEQAADKITRTTGLQCDIEMGFQHADDGWFDRKPVVVGTVQTLNSHARLTKWKPTDFSVLVLDEFHHATAKSYRKILDYFSQNPNLKILGVTATPDRADEEALSQVCESVAFNYGIIDGINDGWLVPITQQFCKVSSLDLSHVRTTDGDLNKEELKRVMEAEETVQGVCHPALEVLYGLEPKTLSNMPVANWAAFIAGLGKNPRQAIVFTVSVAQAEACCNIFNRVVPGIAEWICGETEHESREDILKRFAKKQTAVVANVGVLTEGYDNPLVEVIFMARPTKSRALYSQCIGRATRTLPGLVDGVATADERKKAIADSDKCRCRVIDFCGNSGRHKLVTTLDVLGGKCSDEVIARAIKEAQESGKPVTVLRQLSSAEAKIEKERLEAIKRARDVEEERRKRVVAKADFHQVEVDPFGQSRFGGLGKGKRETGPPATERQKGLLRQYGINVDNLTKKKASWIAGILADHDWLLPNEYKWLRKAV